MAAEYAIAKNEIDRAIDNVDPRKVTMLAAILALGNAADAVEITSVGYVMSEIQPMSTGEKVWLGSSVFVGMLIGGIIFGWFSDRVGRRPCLLACLWLNFLATVVLAAVPYHGVDFLTWCYFIAGVGIGGSSPIVFTLGAELMPAHFRGQYLTAIAGSWMFGTIYASLVGWVLLGKNLNQEKIVEDGGNWRVFVGMCALPAAAMLVLTHGWVPESPLFLLNSGRYELVRKFIKSFSARYGGREGDR